MSEKSLLDDIDRHPLHPWESIKRLGRVIVVAPHPDDEALGCGGLLALLADVNQPARVIVMTDGSRSHPDSVSHPAARLAALRGAESLAALAVLGYPATAVTFMDFEDGGLPAEGTPAFLDATSRLKDLIVDHVPDTIVVPWRRDPHGDHQSTWRICWAAASELSIQFRWLEYPIWAWMPAGAEEAPFASEASVWRLDITPVMQCKQRAIANYRSQLGEVIVDDENGFVPEPCMLAHFAHSWELYLEPHHR